MSLLESKEDSKEPSRLKAVVFDKDRTIFLPFPADMEWRWAGYARRRDFELATEGEVLTAENDTYWYRKSTVRKGTLGLLRLMKAEGLQCGIATLDYEEAARELLEKAGLIDFFHPNGIIGEDSLISVHYKPNPGHFLKVAENMEVNPGDCIMIGDDLEADIAGAKQAGMTTVLVRYWRYTEAEIRSIHPDLVIKGFEELTAGVFRRL